MRTWFLAAAVCAAVSGVSASDGRWLIDDFEKTHFSWTTWADPASLPAERVFTFDAAAGKQAMRITFPRVASTAVIGRQGMRIPREANAVSLWIKRNMGEPQTLLMIKEERPNGNSFVARLPASDGWSRVVVPLERFSPLKGKDPLRRNESISMNFVSYQTPKAGSFSVDQIEWIAMAGEEMAAPALKGRRNLLPGDTGFETGVGSWLYFYADEPLRTTGGALEVKPGKSWISSGWVRGLREPGAEYVLSFDAKGAAGETLTVTLRTLDWEWVAERNFTVTPEWKRYSMKIPARQSVASPAYIALARPVGDRESIWFDSVQFEAGTQPTPYQASEPVSCYATTGASGEVVREGDPVRLTVTIHNADLPREKLPLRLALSAPGWAQNAVFDLQPGKTESRDFDCFEFARASGYYPVSLTLRDRDGELLKQQYLPFVIAPEPEPIRSGEGFCGLHIDYTPQDAMRAIGVSFVRANTTHWNAVSAGPGEFKPMQSRDFSRSRLNWFATLLDVASPPQWGRNPDGKTASPQAFAAFVEHVVRATGKDVAAYEIQNEPDLTLPMRYGLPSQQCAGILAALFRAVHPVLQKSGKPLAFNVSGVGTEFAEAVFREAGKSFDIYAPHTYAGYSRVIGPHSGYVVGPEAGKVREQLLQAVELIRRYGANQELWIGEIGYGLDVDAAPDSVWAYRHGAFLARTLIWARTVPELRRILYFTGLGTFEQSRYEYGIWRNDNGIRPLPAVAAYAAAARRLDAGTDFHIHAQGEFKIVGWRSHDRTIFAVWNAAAGADPLPFELNPEEARVYTLFGTPAKNRFAVADQPFYIHAEPGCEETVLEQLLKTVSSRRPLDVSGSLETNRLLRLRLRNNLDSEFFGTVSVPPGKPVAVRLSPQGEDVVRVELTEESCGGEIRPEFRSADGCFFSPIQLPKMLMIRYRKLAGSWRDFKPAGTSPAFELRERSAIFPADPFVAWRGEKDLSLRAWMFWDEEGLYLFAEVTDDRHSQPFRNGNIWQGDSLQFAFDAANDAPPEGGYDNNDYEYGVALASEGGNPVLWCWQAAAGKTFPGPAAGIEADVNRVGMLTCYRIRIPWEELAPLKPEPGRVIGFNVVVTERDERRAGHHLELAPGLAPYKNPGFFRKIILVR